MKPIFLIAIAFFVINTSFAQKWELGTDGGVVFNTIPSFTNATSLIRPSKLSLTGDVKLIRNFKKWQLGIEGSALRLTYINNGVYLPLTNDNIPGPFSKNSDYKTIILANPAVPVTIFANKIFIHKNQLQMYAGLSAGYAYLSQTFSYPSNFYFVHVHNEGDGYTFGFHVGGTYYLTKHIGLNGEIDANYIHLHYSKWNGFNENVHSYYVFAFPATLGIRYRF